MNMLMCMKKRKEKHTHGGDSRWNMSFHLNWWHYRCWEWPSSTCLLIQHWHNKSQSIWPGRLNWRRPQEIIQIRCSQLVTRFHPPVSRWQIFFFLAAVSVTLSTLPYYLHIHRTGNNYRPWPPCSYKNCGEINEGNMTGHVTRFGFKMSPTKKKGGRRGKVKPEAVMDVINELRCSAPSSSLFHRTPVLAVKQALCCHCLIQFQSTTTRTFSH